MHLAAIDQMASSGTSVFHRAGVPSKLLMMLCLLGAVIGSSDVLALGVLMVILLILHLMARVRFKEIVHLLFYPVFFSLLFALLKFQESWASGLLVVFKGTGAALVTLFLLATTPWVEIFAFLSAYLPGLLVDIFLFTYRSFFILIDQVDSLLRSIKMKGGYHPFSLAMNLKNMAAAVGLILLHSFEMSERMYKIYLLRGYDGGIPITRRWWKLGYPDGVVIILSAFIVVGAVIRWGLW
ncbi:energy-coupling factor transporter transmembrane component T family protein [Caldicoprobacter faecalis]|uniref:Cobalt/nickel transport system permease protein n=1 Tax=Caldicoprobacter faecalis TaxID=937334 RepID=A0A1I5TT12_9FIRM|nr:energy-coupling factor transporter transmembrane component T [Caldicoprobacter faecalis]SFP86051.1 cobalt/nickel transport system permease protein [Caldicoprobacter faecalis]